MNITDECLECIYKQSVRVCDTLGVDKVKKDEILMQSKKMIDNMSFNLSPPQNAAPMYEMIAQKIGVKDLYYRYKQDSIKLALQFNEYCQEIIDSADDKLYLATKVAIIGNVIDLASTHLFDLSYEVKNVINHKFAIDESKALKIKIKEANNIVYLADNAGEDVFDKLYIKTIKELYPDIVVYYFVRGKPIINDLIVSDLKLSKIDEVATIIDTKASTPGIVRESLQAKAKELFEDADLIISKGMGNYECLNEQKELPIFFLLKIKCQVVANSLNQNIGDIICKKI